MGDPINSTNIKTFEDFLKQSGLTELLQELEMSLEDLRRNKKSIDEHEVCFHKTDKQLQKLSANYHPDKVQRSGGTKKELKAAQELQAALNATRTILKSLNSIFTEDIDFYHKFGFYMQLKIGTLNNEDQIKKKVYDFKLKFCKISQIMQEDIKSGIRKFLIESQKYVDSFLNKENSLKNHEDLALFYLKCCINGYEKLCAELEEIKLQCAEEENEENTHSFIQTIVSDTKKNLEVLKLLQVKAKTSLNGKYVFFSPEDDMDSYLVLPLVSYTNVILMCNAMVKGKPYFNFFISHSKSDPHCRDDLEYLMVPYYLASYFSGNNHRENTVRDIMKQFPSRLHLTKENIQYAFCMALKHIKEIMEAQFKIENYNEVHTTKRSTADLEKRATMMNELKSPDKKLSKHTKFQNQIDKMDELDERLGQLNKETDEINLKIKDALELNKTKQEKCSMDNMDEHEEKEKKYQEKYKVTEENLAKVEENNRNMNYKVDKMSKTFTEMKERHDTLLAENKNIEETNKALKVDINEVEANCVEIKQTIKDISFQSSQLLTTLHTMMDKKNKN